MSFSERVKSTREAAHLSQKELAKRSGVSQQAISVIEIGERSPTETTMRMIAEALGCSVAYLMGEETEEVGSKAVTADEKELLKNYRALNRQGQEYIRQTMFMATTIYKKRDNVSGLEDQRIG